MYAFISAFGKADQAELVALLESRGGRLASRLVSQFYPLHAAVMENDLEAVRAAIAAGVNLAAPEYHGLTPLHVACSVAVPPVIQVGPKMRISWWQGWLDGAYDSEGCVCAARGPGVVTYYHP